MHEVPRPRHVMVDLETLGTTEDAPIVQLAAVAFDPDLPGDGLYVHPVEPLSALTVLVDVVDKDQGPVDPRTMLWWMEQEPETRARVFLGTGRKPLRDALVMLASYVRNATDRKDAKVWALGATFDIPILRKAAERCGVQALTEVLQFRNERCARTLQALGRELGVLVPAPLPGCTKHDALSDAREQARYAVAVMRAMKPAAVRS